MALRSIGRKLAPSARRKVQPAPKMAESFYLSPESRALCEELKRERWPRLFALQGHACEDPECKARHSSDMRIFFDHMLERKDRPDLALVKSNIVGRCGSSHSHETAIERARRQREQG